MSGRLTGVYTRYTQVSTLQFILVLMVLVFPTEMFTLPAPLALKAGLNAPWAVLVAGLEALLPFVVGLWASQGRSAVSLYASLRLVSPPTALLLALVFVGCVWALNVLVMAEYAEIVHGFLLPRTPLAIPVFFGITLVAFMTQSTLEPIARMTEIVSVIGLPILALVFLLAMPYMDVHWVEPIWPQQPGLMLKTSILPASYLGEVVLVAVLGSHVAPGTRLLRAGIIATVFNTVILLVSLYLPLLLFGPVHTSVLSSPMLAAVRAIHYGYVLERLDTVVLPIWIVLICLKMAIIAFTGAEALVNAAGHRKTKWLPSALVGSAGIASLYEFQSLPSTIHVIGVMWSQWVFPILVVSVAMSGLALRLGEARSTRPWSTAGPRPTS